MDKCPICKNDADVDSSEVFSVVCPRCGSYQLTRTAEAGLRELESREGANISGWLRENERSEITSENIKKLRSLKTPSFHERADKLLLAFEKKTAFAGEKITINGDKSWLSSAWCIDQELNEIINYLASTGRVALSNAQDFSECKIAPKGWEHLEQLKSINQDSQQGFVAMWFDPDLKDIYDTVIVPAICEAGYKPHRVDKKEHNNQIDNEIIAEIKKSRFVLADFTGHRGGVYFEAGFAKGLGIEVFWTCRKDHFDDLHFDIRQYNCIEWEDKGREEFKKRITFRIQSVLGQGTYKCEYLKEIATLRSQ
ncbi:MAG: hypothetical protein HY954_13040 [Deltaproteobacteria bacterium]|nr:hypothetical protein [Deltaproteobacteria bacterium]